MHIHTNTHAHTHRPIYTHIYKHAHTHTHTHTHITYLECRENRICAECIKYEILIFLIFQAFSKDDKSVTMVTLDPRFQDIIGHTTTISFSDAKTVNVMYNCAREFITPKLPVVVLTIVGNKLGNSFKCGHIHRSLIFKLLLLFLL